MNILRHKSWHVRNRNNINRVKRDEEKARNEELEKEKRIALSESERRVQLLRQRLSSKNGSNSKTDEMSNVGTHLDVFQDFSDKIKTKNKDNEKEIKDEKEKYEKKTGILQYLVDKDIDGQQNWYLDSHEKRMKLTDTSTEEKFSEKLLKDIKTKKFNDPIEDMKRYLDLMKPKTDSKSVSKQKNKKPLETIKTKHKKNKKHKKHKMKKRKHSSTDSSDSEDKSVNQMSKTLEKLRAERLNREKVERERSRALLYGHKETEVILDDRLRKYNSQFNPEIAKQNEKLLHSL